MNIDNNRDTSRVQPGKRDRITSLGIVVWRGVAAYGADTKLALFLASLTPATRRHPHRHHYPVLEALAALAQMSLRKMPSSRTLSNPPQH